MIITIVFKVGETTSLETDITSIMGNKAGSVNAPGNTSTHVANRYHKNIYVRCDAERKYTSMENFTVSTSAGYSGVSVNVKRDGRVFYNWNKIVAGFSKIKPGKFLKFDVDCRDSDTVYISIVAEDGELICNSISKQEDYSVLVDQYGNLRDVVYGTIWTAR